MANTDFGILLKTLLDKTGIDSELEQVQKIVNKYSIDIMPELKTASLRNQMKAVSQEIANDFNKAFGTNLTGKDVFKAYENQVKQMEKANSDAQKKRQAEQERYYNKIINNNKEIYSLKEKKISADKEESKELQRQITNLEKRNKRAYDSISQKGLGDKDWGLKVSDSEKELKNRLAIKEARLQDKANAQEQANIEKQIAEYNKQELEYQKQRKQYEAEGIKQAQDEELLRQSMEYYEQEKYYQETRAKYLAEGKAQEEAYNTEVKETTEYYKQMAKEADKAYESRQRLAEANAKKVDEIQLSWSDGSYEAKYDSLIAKTRQWVDANDESVISTQKLTTAYNEFNTAASNFTKDGSVKNRDILIQKEEELGRQLKATTNDIKVQNAEWAKSSKVDSLHQKIQEFYDKNTATHKKWGSQLKNMLNETAHGAQVTATRVNEIEQEFLGVSNAARQAGKLGLSFFDSITEQAKKFTQWASLSGLIMQAANRVRAANTELKEMNHILTEISKTNDSLTKADLAQIGDDAFEKASKYGKTATDYLTGVQEMSRAGYDNAEEMAELTIAVQSAGDMTAELANSYVIATDKAYQMNGSVQALTKTLDGANNITNNNAVNMTELAEGMSVVGSQAASSQMSVEQTTAAIGTLVAVTQQGGSEMGNAFKGILMNLQQVTGEIDGEEIDATALTKYEKACAELGVSLKEVKNGVVSLKEPMQILKELSVEYQKLDESDAKRANLLSAVGGKYLPRYIEIYN